MMFRQCTGIFGRLFGHKYEARYDDLAPTIEYMKAVDEMESTLEAVPRLVDKGRSEVYVCDVCTRCGDLIQRRPTATRTPDVS